MAGDALDLLTRIAKETSLRYAMHLIMTGALCCKQRKGPEVEVEDVRRCYSLFSDLRRSTQYLIEFNKQYMVRRGVAPPGAAAVQRSHPPPPSFYPSSCSSRSSAARTRTLQLRTPLRETQNPQAQWRRHSAFFSTRSRYY